MRFSLQTAVAQIADELTIKVADIKIENVLTVEVYDISVRNAACSFGTEKRVFLSPGK